MRLWCSCARLCALAHERPLSRRAGSFFSLQAYCCAIGEAAYLAPFGRYAFAYVGRSYGSFCFFRSPILQGVIFLISFR